MQVSVVIPAFNCAEYIERTLDSVLAQSHRDLELIVVDDGSTDDTRSIAARVAARDPRVIVLQQPPSGKAAVARNTGIRASRGELVAFLDADDLFHPEKLAAQVALFARRPELGVVFCDIARFTDDATRFTCTGYLEGLDFLNVAAPHLTHIGGEQYLCDDRFYNFMSARITSLTTCTVMIRRAVLEQEPHCFDESLEIAEDVDLWFRLALRARFGLVARVLSYYRQRPGSLMSNPERVLRGAIAAHGANLERGRSRLTSAEIAVIETRVARQYGLLGNQLLMRGDAAGARAAYRRCRDIDARQFPLLPYLKSFVPQPLLGLARRARARLSGVRKQPAAT
jgi:glycosyltransferase involved in cell wall biosynthesis